MPPERSAAPGADGPRVSTRGGVHHDTTAPENDRRHAGAQPVAAHHRLLRPPRLCRGPLASSRSSFMVVPLLGSAKCSSGCESGLPRHFDIGGSQRPEESLLSCGNGCLPDCLGSHQLLLAKELDHAPPQVLGHPSQVAERDKDEAGRLIEAAFENERVKVRIEPGLHKTGRPGPRRF